jgi:hypothetical protein
MLVRRKPIAGFAASGEVVAFQTRRTQSEILQQVADGNPPFVFLPGSAR